MSLQESNYAFERAAAGGEQGVTPVIIKGENPALTTTLETVRYQSDVYAFLYANTLLSVASSSANDAAAGTGARKVRVTGVNAAGTVISEEVTLNGTTAVQMTAGNELLVVNNIEVTTFGSGGVNAGDIYVGSGVFTAGVPGTHNAGRIPTGYGASQDAVYMVPAGQTLYIKDLFFNASSATSGAQRWVIEVQQSNTQISPKIAFTGNAANTCADVRNLTIPLKFPALTKLQVKALSTAGTGPGYVTLGGYLVKDGVQTFVTL